MQQFDDRDQLQVMNVTKIENVAPTKANGDSSASGLVSVLVPHLNDYENLDVCLTLLQNQSFARDRMEIVVADNGSSRGIEAVREIVGGRGRVVEVAERGAGPARNAAVRTARGEVLAFIDSDCRPDEHWLEEGLAELNFGDFVGGRVEVLVDGRKRLTPAEAFERVFAFRNERYVNELGFSITASMFVRRSVFEAVGGFENGVPEDRDWCDRARSKGYQIRFASKSVVGHPARRTMAELRRKWRRMTLEWCEAERRKGTAPILLLLRQWAVLFSIVPHALVIMTTNRLSRSGDRIRAVSALAHIRAYRFAFAHWTLLQSYRT
ncbi:MAG: glycosyltransferase [Hyphomicrobiales bacterium]|nr:glycosyltransferase [Hyphomicrobiales bacterium]